MLLYFVVATAIVPWMDDYLVLPEISEKENNEVVLSKEWVSPYHHRKLASNLVIIHLKRHKLMLAS